MNTNKANHGLLIVIDGIDGAGKETQWKRLIQKLKSEGYKVKSYDFPQYGKSSARNVEKYLKGEFGPKELIDPKIVSGYYAKDRAAVAHTIQKDLKDALIVVCNRYTSSNAGHQTIRHNSTQERIQYLDWLFKHEYEELSIPKPDATIILDVTAKQGQMNVGKKGERSYIGTGRDIHESDANHLKNAQQVYQWLVSKYDDWHIVDCMENDQMKSIETIHEHVWRTVEPLLPKH